jgi:uncharacterized protein RhaS with RHS repeats
MFRAYDPAHARWLNRDPIGEAGGVNLYAYVEGNPIAYRDPKGTELELALAVIGGGAGAIYGAINGYLAGDRDGALAVDIAAGAGSGALIGLTNGLSLIEGAIVNAGIESYRQLAVSAISGCQKEDARYIVAAGGLSVLGDLAGGAAAYIGAEIDTEAAHMIVNPDTYDNLAKFISLNAGSILNIPLSGAQGGRL